MKKTQIYVGKFKQGYKSRFKFLLLKLVYLLDAVVTITSLGFLTTHWPSDFLFSDWMTDE